MNETFVIYCRSGKRYFATSTTSSQAVAALEATFGERVLTWETADEVPPGTEIWQF